MSSGIASLHKILKDKTRQKIISLLNEKNKLSYTELMDATQAGSTGRLNYHLKVLANLITKNEAGQYSLTEKGKVASKLMLEFPSDDDDYHLYKQLIWATLKQKKPNYLLTVKLLWLLSLLSLLIALLLDAVSINNLIFTWLFFVTGAFYLFLHYRNKPKQTKPHLKTNF
jgi:DNA-binding transcriptional ArsR family regulator